MTEKQKGAATLVFTLMIALAWLSVRLYRGSGPVGQLTRIVSLQHWQLGKPQPNVPALGLTNMPSAAPYVWLTRHELLHFGGPVQNLKAAVYDTETKQDHSAPGLAALQPSPQMINIASPDGEWLLSETPKEQQMAGPNGLRYMVPMASFCAIRCVDGKVIHYPDILGGDCFGYWMPDSRHWITLNRNQFWDISSKRPHVPHAGFGSGRGSPGGVSSALHLAVVGIDPPDVRYISLANMGAYKIIGAAAPDKVVLSAYDPATYLNPPVGAIQPPLSFVEVSLASPQSQVRKFSVAFPQTPSGGSSALLLSPAGDSLLWTCISAQPSLLNWGSSVPERKSVDSWVFPINGGSSHHIGVWSGSQTGDFQWNPDGRHISFSLENILYSVPVP